MTKRWIYGIMVAAIIMVGAIAGPVMAASQGTTAEQAPSTQAPGVVGPDTGTNGMAGSYIYPYNTPPRFEWYVITYPTDTTTTLVYTVPSGYKLQIDDVLISSWSPTYTDAYMYRGTGSTYFSAIRLGSYGHFEHSYQNLVLNGGELLRVRTTNGNYGSAWTITGHWV